MKKNKDYKTCLGCSRLFTERPHSHYCLNCKIETEKPKVKRCQICGDLAMNTRSSFCHQHFEELMTMKVRESV